MEVISYNDPIIITSEDEDDDDVVLVKEEKVVQDAGVNDDVIFVSEESSPFLWKNKSENCQKINKKGLSNGSAVDTNGGFNISHVNVQIFKSSLLSLDSDLQPVDSAESVLLGTDAPSALTETNANLIETLQASYNRAPQQEVDAGLAAGIYSGSSQNKFPECSVQSSISSAFQDNSLLQTTAKTPSDSSTVIQRIDIDNLCMDSPIVFCSDVLDSPSNDSTELVKAETAVSSQSQQSTLPVMTNPRIRDPVPGTSNLGSNSDSLCSGSAFDDLRLCIPEKTTSVNNSDSPLPLDMDIFNAEDLINLFNFFDNPRSEKDQKIANKDVNIPGDSDIKDNKISQLFGSADDRNRTFSLVKPPASTESPASSKVTSQDHCGVTKCDESVTYNIGCLSSDIFSDFQKLTHKSSIVSSVNTDKSMLLPNKLSTAKYNHSSHGSSLINTDTNSWLSSKHFSSGHEPAMIQNLLKSHPYRQKAILNYLTQARKHNLNYCKKRSNSLVKTLLHKISCKSAPQDLDTKAPVPSAAHWKIVSSESSRRKRAHSDIRNNEHLKRKQLSETAEVKPNLKIKLKMISPSSSSVIDSKLSTAYSQCNIGVTKREFVRGESLITKTLVQPFVHRSVSESNTKVGQVARAIQTLCAACCKTVSDKTLARCYRGHDICATCLEPQVKVILTGDVKQKYVRCPTDMCTEALSFDELRKTLPSFVVEILEKKLDKEYLSYITKWMFTDEQLKTRSEFATLDTKVTPAPTLSMRKYEEIYTQESCDVTADLPAFWAPMEHGAPVMAFEVVPDTEEYRALACQFYETCPFGDYDIARIIRVQNPILWKYFALKQSEMIQENDGMDVMVKQLYHGTHHSTLEAIARKGFDWRLSGKHGTVYGNGSYFARTANYSHSYTDCAGNGVSVKAGSRPSYMYHPGTSSSSSSLNHYSFSSLRQSSLWSTFPTLQSLSGPVFLCSSQRQSLQSGLSRDSNTAPAHSQAPHTTQAQPSQPAVKDAASGLAPSTCRASSFGSSLDALFGSSTIYMNYKSSSAASPTTPSPQNHSSHFSSCLKNPTPATSWFEHLRTAPMPALSLWDSLEDSLKDKTDDQIKSDQVGLTASCSGSAAAPQRREKGTANLTAAFARSPNSKTHFMFMAKVLVGRHTGGKSGLKRPPPLDESNPYGKCYDSCVDNIFSPQVYVIFDSNQAYPEYVIEYNSLKS